MQSKQCWKRPLAQTFAAEVFAAATLLAPASRAQISKANQILINRGLQVEGLVLTYDTFHLSTYTNANYTAVNWTWDPPRSYSSSMSQLGAAPGFPWGRWASDETDMPPLGAESPYLSQLVNLQLGDEWNLNDNATRTRAVNWFNAVRANWPNTILYANNWGGQVTDSNLVDFVSRAQPDMITFDSYPWKSVYDTNAPGDIGAPIGGPPTGWYGNLRTYRDIARAYNIPFGSYVQTFHSVEQYAPYNVYRSPSPSELRLNHSGALAFNSKMLIDFLYNNGSSSLFNAPGGDSYPNALYYDKADCALRARNLGKALVRLKPIDEATASWTTSVMFIRGKDPSGALNPIPANFYAGPSGTNPNTDWVADRNDPYLRGWVVTNTGTKNNGQPGDVIIAWFKLLDESFDGPDYTNELYFMVVNGLTDTNGTAADCSQEIKLNFLNTFSAVELLNPETGLAQAQVLPIVSTRRQLVFDLNGGDAALFKIADGAPFVGVQLTGPPVIVSQPVSRTCVVGTNATFSVTASGLSPLKYQWRFNGGNISGATTNVYTRSGLQTGDAGSYTVVVTNSMGSVTSAVATFTVQAPPQITTQPQSQSVNAGFDAAFSVVASGTPAPGYQWRFNGTDIIGATASGYTRTNVQSADAGTYSVVVSNVLGAAVSSNAVLTVNGPPSITVQPQNQVALIGGNAGFSAAAVGAPTLHFQWRKDGVNLSDGGGISGATTSSLGLSNVQAANLGSYTVTVSNGYGGVISQRATLSLATPPSIQVQPQNRTNAAGTTATFEVVASGGGLNYQWQRSGTNITDGGYISGAGTDLLVLAPATKSDETSYTVVITNLAGSVTSSPASLSISYQPPFREPFDYDAGENLGGQTGPCSLTWADVGTSTAGPYITIQSNSLEEAGLVAPFGNSMHFGGLGKSARLSLPSPYTTGSLYYSFALKILDLAGATASGGFIAGFNNSIGTQTGQPTVVGTRVYARTAEGGFNLGVAKNSSTTTDWVWDETVFNTNETIFLVGSYTFTTAGGTTDDISKLWVNPDPAAFGAADPPATALIATGGNDIPGVSGNPPQIASFVFFQRSDVNEPAAMIADELRVATTWAGVTPPAAQVRITSITALPDGRIRLWGNGDPGHFAILSSLDLKGWIEQTTVLSATGDFVYIEPFSYAGGRYYRAEHYQ